MTTATRKLTHLEIMEQIKAERRANWPAGVVECGRCGGSGQIDIGFVDGSPVHSDCPQCLFGYQMPDPRAAKV